mgnify:CR=1 FL=1
MRVEDLTKFEGECPNIVVFGTYMDIRVPFLKKAEGYPVDVDWGTQGFYRCNDAGTLPGECADFIFHKCNN